MSSSGQRAPILLLISATSTPSSVHRANVSVHSKPSVEDTGKTNEVRTVVLPQSEVPVTETPGIADNDRPAMRKMANEGYLDMKRLAEFEKNQLINVLTILTEDFAAWIDEQNDRIGNELTGFEGTAYESMVQSGIILERLREGIKTLETNDRALEAFRFANIAMANQRVRSVYALRKRRGENPEISDIDIPGSKSTISSVGQTFVTRSSHYPQALL